MPIISINNNGLYKKTYNPLSDTQFSTNYNLKTKNNNNKKKHAGGRMGVKLIATAITKV